MAGSTNDNAAGSSPDSAKKIRSILTRVKNRKKGGADLDVNLYAEGIGLDSLDVAELSAVLEDEFGSDPFSNGEMPETVGEIAAFYDSAPAADQ